MTNEPLTKEQALAVLKSYKFKRLKNTNGSPGTDKLSKVCPRCGRNGYGYHNGIYKDCNLCGFDRFYDKRVRYFLRGLQNDNDSVLTSPNFKPTIDYIKGLTPIPEKPSIFRSD